MDEKPSPLRAVSLFAGIGGFDLAMERAGIETIAAVEIDKHCRRVLARHFPKAQLFNDVTEVTGDQLMSTGFRPRIDILTGGFPCQDLSVAGRRAGLTGGRSGLFWEIDRLVEEIQPGWVVLENVPGLLSSNGWRDLGAVLGALAQRGYGVSYRILDAQYFGLAQKRRRVFIVCDLGGSGERGSEVLALSAGLRGDPSEGVEEGEGAESEVRGGVAGDLALPLGSNQTGGPRLDLDHDTYVVERRLRPDGEDGLVGAVSSKWARGPEGPAGDEAYNLILEDEPLASIPISATRPTSPRETPAITIQGGAPSIFVKGRRAQSAEDDETRNEGELAPTLNSFDQGDVRATVAIIEEPEPIVFDDRRRDGPVVREHLASTLQAHAGTGGNNVPNVARGTNVRRLTPKECERLQGFPDDWTADQRDGHRYRQLGNAVAVPVVEWIMQRLVAVDRDPSAFTEN